MTTPGSVYSSLFAGEGMNSSDDGSGDDKMQIDNGISSNGHLQLGRLVITDLFSNV